MDFDTLSGAILTKLQTITQLQEVYDYHRENFNGYPACTFEPSALNNEFHTNRENKREYVFNIIVHQEIDAATRRNSIKYLHRAVDAIKAAFDADFTLGVRVHRTDPIRVTFGNYVSGGGSRNFALITYSCMISEIVF